MIEAAKDKVRIVSNFEIDMVAALCSAGQAINPTSISDSCNAPNISP